MHTFYQVLVSTAKTESNIICSLYSSFWVKFLYFQFFVSALVVFLTGYVYVLGFGTKPGRLCGLPVAYLLFCKDTFITLAFESIRTSYLVHVGLLAMATYGITHCYGNLVTMATEACVCNFAV